MPAAKYTFPTIEQGATYSHVLTWLQSDGLTPVDLTGCTAAMQIRPDTEGTVLIELNTENARITITPLIGRLTFSITDEDTSLLPETKNAVYDLEIYHSDGTTTRLVQGKVSISREVTRV